VYTQWGSVRIAGVLYSPACWCGSEILNVIWRTPPGVRHRCVRHTAGKIIFTGGSTTHEFLLSSSRRGMLQAGRGSSSRVRFRLSGVTPGDRVGLTFRRVSGRCAKAQASSRRVRLVGHFAPLTHAEPSASDGTNWRHFASPMRQLGATSHRSSPKLTHGACAALRTRSSRGIFSYRTPTVMEGKR
jgi:hypothetical protein